MATKQFTAWSFSRYSDYRTCPAKAKYKHLDRLPEPKSEVLERGSRIHTLAETYIKGHLKTIPAELKKFDATFKRLRKKHLNSPDKVLVEQSWSFTKEWGVTRWDDWTGCAVRLKVDCVEFDDGNVIYVYDWKTGKYRTEKAEEYLEQLELYALGALLNYPAAVVIPKLAYLDTGDKHPSIDVEHIARDVQYLKEKWEKRVTPMLNDTTFAPTPSYGCRWCHYRKENGGPCAF